MAAHTARPGRSPDTPDGAPLRGPPGRLDYVLFAPADGLRELHRAAIATGDQHRRHHVALQSLGVGGLAPLGGLGRVNRQAERIAPQGAPQHGEGLAGPGERVGVAILPPKRTTMRPEVVRFQGSPSKSKPMSVSAWRACEPMAPLGRPPVCFTVWSTSSTEVPAQRNGATVSRCHS